MIGVGEGSQQESGGEEKGCGRGGETIRAGRGYDREDNRSRGGETRGAEVGEGRR